MKHSTELKNPVIIAQPSKFAQACAEIENYCQCDIEERCGYCGHYIFAHKGDFCPACGFNRNIKPCPPVMCGIVTKKRHPYNDENEALGL